MRLCLASRLAPAGKCRSMSLPAGAAGPVSPALRVYRSVAARHHVLVMKGEEWDVGIVLDHGLPPFPVQLSPGDDVPVALWRRGRIGAVLSIIYDADDDHGEPYSQDIEIRFRESDGSWKWLSTGGSDWPYGIGERPSGNPHVCFAAGASSPVDGEHFLIASGSAPEGVHKVRLASGRDDGVSDVEPVTGAFLLRVVEADVGSYTAVVDAT
jgi:hypothetical protein